MRSAVDSAKNAASTAANTSANFGGDASAIAGHLTPFLTSELEHPQGYSQQDTSSMLAAGLGGAGGANSGLMGQANQRAAVSRNAGGFQAALDDAARQRSKAAASTSEGIAADNANLKQSQQQDAERGLQGMYGTDTSGMLNASGQIAGDVNAQTNAMSQGWMQQAKGLLGLAGQGASQAAGFGIPGFSGFQGKQ